MKRTTFALRRSASTLAMLAAASAPALAQTETTDSEGSPLALGFAVAMPYKPYRDFDDKAQVLPMIVYENRWISVAGPGLDIKLPSVGPVSLRMRVTYSGDGYEADDSPFLQGMAERKASFWVGGAAIWKTDATTFSAELLTDAFGHSKGNKFKLSASRDYQFGRFQVTPHIAANWLDRKFVDYYYGVRSAEVLANRALYAGRSTTNVELGLRVGYRLAPQQSVFVDVSGTALGTGIKDSPLVDRSSPVGIRFAYLYRF